MENPQDSSWNAISYAHEHAKEIIQGIVSDMVFSMKYKKEDVLDIVGYPAPGYNDSHFNLTIMMFIDRNKSRINPEKPVVGWEINTEYSVNDGMLEKTMGSNTSLFTCHRKPTEAEITDYLKTNGNEPYRIGFPNKP